MGKGRKQATRRHASRRSTSDQPEPAAAGCPCWTHALLLAPWRVPGRPHRIVRLLRCWTCGDFCAGALCPGACACMCACIATACDDTRHRNRRPLSCPRWVVWKSVGRRAGVSRRTSLRARPSQSCAAADAPGGAEPGVLRLARRAAVSLLFAASFRSCAAASARLARAPHVARATRECATARAAQTEVLCARARVAKCCAGCVGTSSDGGRRARGACRVLSVSHGSRSCSDAALRRAARSSSRGRRTPTREHPC